MKEAAKAMHTDHNIPAKKGRTPKTLLLALLLLTVAILVAACGTSIVDTQKAESVLKKDVVAQTGVAIASVSCPDNVAAKKGATFTCVAHGADGTHAPINVQQTDNQGNVNYNADLVKQSTVQGEISASLTSQQVTLSSIHCPDVVEYVAGGHYSCDLTDQSGQTAHAIVTMAAGGHVSFSISR